MTYILGNLDRGVGRKYDHDEIKDLINKGYTKSEICSKTGMSLSTLYNIIKKYDLVMRYTGRKKINIHDVLLYLKHGYKKTAIARKYNCSVAAISNIQKKYGNK
ncbi:helix-turn-helix domain-containing protein [Vibrio harveyi]|uniref:helix-turn-helix domain-containing protein n=1 Tax=Vibrio harveyi TaxID=669 RepID=UPI003CF50937